MSTSNLPYIQKEMIRYGMTVYLALGLIGNICNCIIFQQSSHRRTPTSLYFLFFAIFAIIYLTWSLCPFIYNLNNVDLSTYSLFYCKIKLYLSHTLGLYLRYLIVFACADRYFATQIDARTRSFNSVPVAIKLIVIMCIICPSIACHLPILTTIRNGVCGMYGTYQFIYSIYQTIFIGTLPPISMSIFSILTLRTLRKRPGMLTGARRKDRYLLRMVIAEVILNITITIPYSVNLIYGAVTYNTVKSTQRIQIEAFINFAVQFLIYITGVVPFYLFLIASKPFRNEFVALVIKFLQKYILRRRVQVAPLTTRNNTATNHHQTT